MNAFSLQSFYISLISIFIYTFVLAETQPNKVDVILGSSLESYKSQQYELSYKQADSAYKVSVKIPYSKGIVQSTLYKSKVLIDLGLYKDALKILNEIVNEPAYKKHVILQTESNRLRGRAFGYLELYDLAIKEFKKQIENASDIKDEFKSNLATLWAYQNLEFIYTQIGDKNKVKKYIDLQEKKLSRLDSNIYFHEFANFNTSKANYLANQGNFEDAIKLLTQSLHILEKNNSNAMFKVYTAFASLYDRKKYLNEASKYFQLALANAALLDDLDAKANISKTYSEFLSANNLDEKLAQSLLIQYINYKDSLNKVNRFAVDDIYKNIIIKDKSDKITLTYKFAFGLLTILFLLYFIQYFYMQKKYLKPIFTLPKQADKYVTNSSEEIEHSFNINDLIELAKNNNPEFLFIFESIYPNVINNFRKLDSNMRSSELYFLALSYLNFSPKEIAKCSNVTVRAVQIRKNRYRKKYQIPSDVDFNTWINSMYKQSQDEVFNNH